MKLKKLIKNKYIIFLIILVLAITVYFVLYESHYKIIWKHENIRKEEIKKIEQSFNRSPKISDAYDLLEYYLSEEKYEKALLYGKACLNLGADDGSLGGRINFFLARICYELKDFEQARKYLEVAFSMSDSEIVEKYETVKKYGMEKLLSSNEWEKILRNK